MTNNNNNTNDDMEVRFVTSFSADGYSRYAKNMLESVVDKWDPNGLSLIAYYHDCPEELVDTFPKAENIEYRNLNLDQEMLDYRERMALHDGTEGGKVPYNWRLDAIKWCHKVFALTSLSLEIGETEECGGWLVWLDADTITKKLLHKEDILGLLPNGCELVHLGRNDTDYSETSFMAFNLDYVSPHALLIDLRGAYLINEVLSYREWHDGFIFERLLNLYKAHGLKVHNLTPNVKGLAAFAQSPLTQWMSHFKGNLKDADGIAPDIKLPRYAQLADLVRHTKPSKIVEVGTWQGGRAIEMALAAFETTDEVTYIGFDLFEDATEESDIEELNTKAHHTIDQVRNRLDEFSKKMEEQGKTFNFHLFKGDSKLTMETASVLYEDADFAYIDGGHSEDTVRSDYSFLKHVPMVVFDDFFSPDEDGNCQPDEYLGTNRLVEELKAVVLPSSDKVLGGGHTHLAVLNNTGNPLPDSLSRVPIVVRPKDSVPKEHILDNINTNVDLINRWGIIAQCPPNTEHAIIVSGGPSTDYAEVKRVQESTGGTVMCVKHSYNKLLEAGIQPYACVILDPRDIAGTSTHGIRRKSLFKSVDSRTLFLLASMTDPSVTKYLMRKTKNVYGWHAYSQAVKDKVSKQGEIKIEDGLNIDEDTVFVTGGTCAATRTIGLMHIWGFRTFHLFGFDSSLPEEPTKKMKKERIEGDRPKYIKVETNDVNFWTTGELLALAQDMEKMFNDMNIEMRMYVYGEGTLVKELYSTSQRNTDDKYFKSLVQQFY